MEPEIYCADVGSVTLGRFAWFSSRDNTIVDGHKRIQDLVGRVAEDLQRARPVALGFECPLYVPLATEPELLTQARPGERDRPWSAGAGCDALTTGLVQVLWILHQLKARLDRDVPSFLDWRAFESHGSGLFLWEAFVSGGAKTNGHCEDARAGVDAFRAALPVPRTCLECSGASYSLAGAALLRSGWSTDVALLAQPCIVIRGSERRQRSQQRRQFDLA
jgi:hypothetical protein